jgi:hypothetical protein
VARENGAILMFEAAVGGGYNPLSPQLIEHLKTNRITRINGILNAHTTNYILTKITREKRPSKKCSRKRMAIVLPKPTRRRHRRIRYHAQNLHFDFDSPL